MTFDQFTHLLAVLAWPIVALISSVALVHVARLLLESVDEWVRTLKRIAEMYCTSVVSVWGDKPLNPRDRLRKTSETAMLTILQAVGGFPVDNSVHGDGEQASRALVRELRRMYDEIERPTAPKRRPEQSDDGLADLDADDPRVANVYSEGDDLEIESDEPGDADDDL